MKKITLMMFAVMAAFTIQAQNPEVETVLSQNTGDFVAGGVSCGPTGDNWYFRAYELGANGVTQNVGIVGVEFGIESINAEVELTVYAWDIVGFPGSFDITNPPTPIAIGYVTVGPADQGQRIRADFDTPAVGNEDSNIVIAVVLPDETATFYLYPTPTDSAPTWLASESCEINNPTKVADIGFPGAKHLIDLIIDDALSVNDVLSQSVSVYPNPSSDVFNISLPSNVEVMSSSLVDVLGKTTGVVYSNGGMNVSALAPGVYFLNLETNLGSYNQKVVVKQ